MTSLWTQVKVKYPGLGEEHALLTHLWIKPRENAVIWHVDCIYIFKSWKWLIQLSLGILNQNNSGNVGRMIYLGKTRWYAKFHRKILKILQNQ